MRIKGRFLYFISPDEGLFFKNFSLYRTNLKDYSSEFIVSLRVNNWKRLLSHFRLLNRLLRLEPKCAGKLSDGRYVICMMAKLWLVDLNKKNFIIIANMRSGFTTLNFCECNDSLFFGDYGINRGHKVINIFKIDQNLNLSVVYSFPARKIRHIHNIVNDKDNNWLWILTGDNEPQAGIYKSDYEFKSIRPFVKGEQRFRAVVAFPYRNGIVYATDSVEEENFIYWLEENGRMTELASINGSCIYGTETRDYFIFSTTVESKEGTGILNMLSYKLGCGIKSRDVHVLVVRKKDLSVRIIAKYRKDWLPMKLFQYGRMIFPGGQQISNELWTYNLACKGLDGKSFKIEL